MLSDRTIKALSGISKATLNKDVGIKDLFRIMTHYPDLWMQAYANIYANKGAITKGVNKNTLDGMCEDRILNLMKLLKDGKYRPKPVRRVYIPKKNGKKRPLGVPGGNDKLVQEVIRIILEQIYEPVFSNRSHGFRPKRSCHTALVQIERGWKAPKWFVDMDISGFYDNINHQILVRVLEKKIADRKFIKLIKMILQAGYVEDWKFFKTQSGTPQGGICSPILANIFLNELDKFMEDKIESFNTGKGRKRNPEYYHLMDRAFARRRELKNLEKQGGGLPWVIPDLKEEVRNFESRMRELPSSDPNDPNFKRLQYVRYADDFVMAVIGSKDDAKKIYQEVATFLKEELMLDISEEKSGIHHTKDGIDFLGYHVSHEVGRDRMVKKVCGRDRFGNKTYGTQRTMNAKVFLQCPKEKVWKFCRDRGYLGKGNKPTSRAQLLNLSDYEIVATFNAEMRGFANFYNLAPKENLYILEWAATSSLFITLASKHKTSSQKIRRKLKVGDDHVLRFKVGDKEKCTTVFKIKYRAQPDHRKVDSLPNTFIYSARTEVTQRLAANQCEYCGKKQGYFEVHHVRKVKDLIAKQNKAPWEIRMCARNRKTLVLCIECHKALHAGTLQGWKRDSYTKMESVVQ